MSEVEIEIRRKLRLTPNLNRNIRKHFKAIKTVYIIFFKELRAFVNYNPHIECKILERTYPIFFEYSLEICYVSTETTESMVQLNKIIKHGNLVRKTVYISKGLLTLYTLEHLEVTGSYDKCVLELEQPEKAPEHLKQLYLSLAFRFGLLNDINSLRFSIENVIHDTKVIPGSVSYPKVDGERGILIFYDGHNVFTSNRESTILNLEFQKEVTFYLRGIPFVVEYVKANNCYVFIDLPLSVYFNATQRLMFINKLGQVTNFKNKHILFQVYDDNYISENVKIDGKIFITNDKLYKQKNVLSVDLKYNSILNGMVDRDGGFYITEGKYDNGVIYECTLNNDKSIREVLRPRLDKFYPNSILTVCSIYN